MNVVYAMTRNVYRQILPSLRSLVEHDPDASVFVLAEDDKLPFETPIPVQVFNVSGQEWFPRSGVNYKNAFTYINLLKVRYPSILSDVEKVIHLDIDTIVCDSLRGLWETDLDGKWFGAVEEKEGQYKPFGRQYYNLGVAVINLEQMRRDGIEQTMQDYLNNVKQPWADQDAWNKYGLKERKIVPLDVRYNESPVTGHTDNPAIVHFCSIKDWYTRRNMFRVRYLDKYRTDMEKVSTRILIAVPTYENIYPDTFKSVYQLDKGGMTVDFDFVRGYDVANARNKIAQMATDGGYDYVFMVDNDEVIPQHALLELMSVMDSDPSCGMAVGYCLSRPRGKANDSGRTTAFKFGGKDYVYTDAYTISEFKEIAEKGASRVQIRGTGLGCALIRCDVFEKMRYPWFKWIAYESKAQLSEDLYFCEQFKTIGKTIFAVPSVRCGHMMRYVAWE